MYMKILIHRDKVFVWCVDKHVRKGNGFTTLCYWGEAGDPCAVVYKAK